MPEKYPESQSDYLTLFQSDKSPLSGKMKTPLMSEFFKIANENGVFKTVLPPFDSQDWPHIIPTQGYVWIKNHPFEFPDQLNSLVSNAIFKTEALDLKCSIHRLEMDLSIPASDFLRFAETTFQHGLDFILSEKHQPSGFQLTSIPESRRPDVMCENQIILTFHRPAGGEPSVLISPKKEILKSIIDRFLPE